MKYFELRSKVYAKVLVPVSGCTCVEQLPRKQFAGQNTLLCGTASVPLLQVYVPCIAHF